MKVLIHTCCGPCLIYPYEQLIGEGHEVASLFYNPNIHSFQEYRKRLEVVESYTGKLGIDLIVGEYDIAEYFRCVAFHEREGERCQFCYQLRLDETSRQAAEKGFDAFTSTLLVSPYQDTSLIRRLGGSAAKKHRSRFLYRDFRDGYRQTVTKSRQLGMYRQKYCGCIFSEKERFYKAPK